MGRLFEGGAYSKGGTYMNLIFPKSWPDMITFLINHLRIQCMQQHKLFVDIKS